MSYEVRADDSPSALPYGTSVISTHTTAHEAQKAIEQERRDFRNSPHWTDGCYLPRLVVEVDVDGNDVRLVPAEWPTWIKCVRCSDWEELAPSDSVESRTINDDTWCLRCSSRHHSQEVTR